MHLDINYWCLDSHLEIQSFFFDSNIYKPFNVCVIHIRFLLWVVKTNAAADVGDFHRAIAVGFKSVSVALCSLWHDDSSWRTATWGEKLTKKEKLSNTKNKQKIIYGEKKMHLEAKGHSIIRCTY